MPIKHTKKNTKTEGTCTYANTNSVIIFLSFSKKQNNGLGVGSSFIFLHDLLVDKNKLGV
jgi:hypothetical protein